MRAGEASGEAPDRPGVPAPPSPGAIRVAVFNVQELSLDKVLQADPVHPQVEAAAAILRAVRPDILVLQEVDLVVDGTASPDTAVAVFQARHLEAPGAGGAPPLHLPWRFAVPGNTGVLSSLDLDGDGLAADTTFRGTDAHGQDSWGYGRYPGQYSMALLSRFPVDPALARTFRDFRWADLPGNVMPPGFFSARVEGEVRLSSKSHWDVAVETPAGPLHVWVSHPTPPAFDGEERRNRRRNFDEIAFWVRYLDGDPALYDDLGGRGGWNGTPFVIAGDLNADPEFDTYRFGGRTPMGQLLEHPAVQDTERFTRSPYRGLHTATFLDGRRVDYVLADARLRVVGGGVYWPDPSLDPEGAARAGLASDHRLVWIDVALPFPGRTTGEDPGSAEPAPGPPVATP